MRLICYLSQEEYQDVLSVTGPNAEEESFLRSFECMYPPPENIFQQANQDACNLDLDTHDDIVLIDTDVHTSFEAIVIFSLYTLKIPVYVCAQREKKEEVLSALVQDHPLLEVGEKNMLKQYLQGFTNKGKLISFEGGDGVGKQTQTARMKAVLETLGYEVRTVDFPHDTAKFGKLIRRILRSDYGTIKEIHPVLFASLYGFNRADLRGVLSYWLKRSCIVLLDRYCESNFGHQLSKLSSDEERIILLQALIDFEHTWLGLPRSNIVLYLDLPPSIAKSALVSDGTRASLDIHETATEYKEQVRQTFLWCSKRLENWKVVNCLSANEAEQSSFTRLSVDDVHRICLKNVMEILQ